jgi:hypothetical protein
MGRRGECIYRNSQATPKATLRAELRLLQKDRDETDSLLDALRSDAMIGTDMNTKVILQALTRGDSRVRQAGARTFSLIF